MRARSVLLFSGCLVLILSSFVLMRRIPSPYHAHVVLSGSMGRKMPVGSLVLTYKVAPNRYRRGDIIVFRAPQRTGELVVHRVTQIEQVPGGTIEVHTKGDANANGDPWTISRGAIVGRVVITIPWLGGWLHYLAYPSVFLAIAIISFLIFVLPVSLRVYQILQV